MRDLEVDLAGVTICITVDDLPVHGPLPRGMSRMDVMKTFVDALAKHEVEGVYGFVNGVSLEPSLQSNFLRGCAKVKTVRKLVNVCSRLGFDLVHYMGNHQTDASSEYHEILKYWCDRGHHVANHNYWHSNLNTTSASLFIAGVEKNEKVLGLYPAPPTKYFRYPYMREGNEKGKRDAVRRHLQEKGYTTATGTFAWGDWAWNQSYVKFVNGDFSAERIERLNQTCIEMAILNLKAAVLACRKVIGRDVPQICIVHIGAHTALLLDTILSRLKQLGVRFVSLESAMADTVFSETLQLVLSEGKPWLEQKLEEMKAPVCKQVSFAYQIDAESVTSSSAKKGAEIE